MAIAPATRALPPYHALQAAFHESFRPELHAVVDQLPLESAAAVLDVPCGDGFYARRLAERLGTAGRLTCVDASTAYLDLVQSARRTQTPNLVKGDAHQLPFADESFDVVWCAQSLISLDQPVEVLRELGRVLRPGGTLAVLEKDGFHHVLLPWPVELELAIHRALQEASQARYGDRGRLAPARHVRRMLLEAGLVRLHKVTVPGDRQPPFPPCEALFLRRHLESLKELIWEHLRAAERYAFAFCADPDAVGGFFRRPDMELTCLNTLHLGRKGRLRQGGK